MTAAIWAMFRLASFVIGLFAHHRADEVLKRGAAGTLGMIGAISLLRARRFAAVACSAAALVTIGHNAYRFAVAGYAADPDPNGLAVLAMTNGIPLAIAIYAVLARPRG